MKSLNAELLRLAASVEKGSEHPLGEAIMAEAGNRGLLLSDPQGFKAEVGHGVQAQVDGKLVRWAICACSRRATCPSMAWQKKSTGCKAKPRQPWWWRWTTACAA
jgi:cation transport ATPase